MPGVWCCERSRLLYLLLAGKESKAMIYVDSRVGSKELFPIIQRIGVPCELTKLEYADACFEGRGPNGTIAIGVERKTLNDFLTCIEDARYVSHQRPGMAMMYTKSFLCLEGRSEE